MLTKSYPRIRLLTCLALVGAFTTVAASAQPGTAPQPLAGTVSRMVAPAQPLAGTVSKVVAPARPQMTSDRAAMSVQAGGWQRFHLHAGSQQAGGFYLILGSISGTGPGIRIYETTIPLNYDVYTEFTLTRPNAGFLLNQVGRLDAAGNAKAGFFLPLGLARDFAGLEINHAYVLDGVDGTIMASNPVPLLLTD